mmetsp:Transcript_30576/g.40672  ORF Transcript_30576/g.40672 Transcript_30576/m.40672 type:complete len:107 (-) Transcript_30576:424-744(-)
MMPQLHNSSTKASVLVQKPFKQIHVDKRILNVDSTQSKFSSNLKEPSRDKRSVSGFNPPGLTARKFDSMLRSPQSIRDNEIPILDRSLESKDFEQATSGSVIVDEA